MDEPLFAMTRTGDPDTSREAAASLGDVRASQRAVWKVLNVRGPIPDEELVTSYRSLIAGGVPCCFQGVWVPFLAAHLPPQSPSGIRTRRAELVRQGLCEWTGDRVLLDSGRWARTWRTR